MPEDPVQRAAEFLKDRYADGELDRETLEQRIAALLGAESGSDIAAVVRSVPSPVAFTDPERRLTRPLEFNSTLGRVRLTARWQLGKETHISAGVGSILVDLTEAQFDDHTVDLHITTGWGRITVIVPRGVDVQIVEHRGGVRRQLEDPVPGLPLVRLDVKTNIGTVHIRHPNARDRRRRRRGAAST